MSILTKKIPSPSLPGWIKKLSHYLSILLLLSILLFELERFITCLLFSDGFSTNLWIGLWHGFLAWAIDSRYLLLIISLLIIFKNKHRE